MIYQSTTLLHPGFLGKYPAFPAHMNALAIFAFPAEARTPRDMEGNMHTSGRVQCQPRSETPQKDRIPD